MKERNMIQFVKGLVASFMSVVLEEFGLFGPVMIVLLIVMAIDFITGIIASAYETVKDPDNNEKGLSSKRGALGIYKKVSYLFAVIVGLLLDYIIILVSHEAGITLGMKTFFGVLVALWYIFNDVLSILENIDRVNRVPAWLANTVRFLQNKVDSRGEEMSNQFDDSEKEKAEESHDKE